nr:uncharacterized protein LOC123753226 [Procambarus clarkii]
MTSFQLVIDGILEKKGVEGTFAHVDDVFVCGDSEEDHDKNLKHFMDVARRAMGMPAHFSCWVLGFSEKIRSLSHANDFHLSAAAVKAFEGLKRDIAEAVVRAINQTALETFTSDHAIAVTLTQNEQPVAFFSRTLSNSEQRHLEKEAYAVVEALRKWRHYLTGRHFWLVTDQRSVAFMFNSKSATSELKPRFYKFDSGHLIKATQPFERLNIDFKGSHSRNKYILTVVDEFSRFPCSDMTTGTLIECLVQLFAIFGMPAYIHSDRETSFMSKELKGFLLKKVVATSRTTPYNPRGNGQDD